MGYHEQTHPRTTLAARCGQITAGDFSEEENREGRGGLKSVHHPTLLTFPKMSYKGAQLYLPRGVRPSDRCGYQARVMPSYLKVRMNRYHPT